MKPEEKARQKIDQLLVDAGWIIQDHKDLNLGASMGVAVREFPVSTGYADYMLFVDRRAAGVIEAKPEGMTLSSAEYQSDKYLCLLSPDIRCFQNPLSFAYENTGVETFVSKPCMAKTERPVRDD
jgi:type I restriction enzyme, R subunit